MKRRLFRMIVPAYPSFNIYTRIADKTTALGPIIVASAANKLPGWEVEVIDENNCSRRRPAWLKTGSNGKINHERLQQERPADIVGFYGSLSSTIPRIYELAKIYQTLGAITIVGGYHVRALPQEMLDHNIDLVAIDGGEQTIIDILQAYGLYLKQNSDRSAGIDYKTLSAYWCMVSDTAFMVGGEMTLTPQRARTESCPPWPLPDFSLLRWARLKVFPINWRRGCPYNCEFCAVKEKPTEATAEELLELVSYYHEKFNAMNFFIVDDHFGGNLNNPNERAELIKALGLLVDYQKKIGRRLNFTIQIRLNISKDGELLKLMRQAGITTVCIGYESPIDEELKTMRKGYTAKEMVAWTNLWHKAGMFVHGMFIFAYPEKKPDQAKKVIDLFIKKINQLYEEAQKTRDTELYKAKLLAIEILIAEISKEISMINEQKSRSSIAETVAIYRRFVKEARIDTLQVLLAVPLPGTDLRRRLEDEGRILPLSWQYYDGQFPLYLPDNCSPEELQAGMKEIMGKFYGFRNILRVLWNWVFHFPRIVFPAALTIATFQVTEIKKAYLGWRKNYHRNAWVRSGGWLVAKGWAKKFRRSDFPEQLKKAEEALANANQQEDNSQKGKN